MIFFDFRLRLFLFFVTLCGVFFLAFNVVFAINIDAYKQINLTEQEVLFDSRYNSLLDTGDTTICLDNECKTTKDVIIYKYISDNIVNENVISYNTIRNNNEYRVYSGSPFYEIDNTFYLVEQDYVDPEVYNQVITSKLSLINQILHNNPFGIYRVQAATSTIFSNTDGDGYSGARDTDNTWDSVHHHSGDATWTKTSSQNEISWGMAGNYSNTVMEIRRGQLVFDTSSLDDTATITSATLDIYVVTSPTYDNDGNDTIAVVQNYQANTSSMDYSDYVDVGSDNSSAARAQYTPTILLSTAIDVSSNITDSQYNTLTLNGTGEAYINRAGYTKLGLRAGHDYLDSQPAAEGTGSGEAWFNGVSYYNSARTGTSEDPYLTIVQAESGSSTPATSSVIYMDADWYSDDLTIIKGKTEIYTTSTTTPSEIRYHFFHIPFFAWIVIFSAILIVGSRLILEIIIRFRNDRHN